MVAESSRIPAQLPAIFIAAQNGEAYRELLVRELGERVKITVARTPREVIRRYGGEPVILGRPDFLVELIEARPPVHWVQSIWAGVAPLIRLEFRDYRLTGARGVFGEQMSEYVFAYLLAREIRLEARRQAQEERRWDNRESGSLGGKVLGIMGTGAIGRSLARTALHFGMVPIGFNRGGAAPKPFAQTYTRGSLYEFLERSDYLVGVLPDTPETSRLLDAEALSHLKESAMLINVGRGNLVDDGALVQALEEKRLAGAVLDVFDNEPLPPDSPLWQTRNLHITGHVAASSRPADIARLFLDNYQLFVRGEKLRHPVDFSRGY